MVLPAFSTNRLASCIDSLSQRLGLCSRSNCASTRIQGPDLLVCRLALQDSPKLRVAIVGSGLAGLFHGS